jgi:DNA-binding GntR family transcriptional regulator
VGFAVAPMPSHDYYRQLYDFRLLIEPWAASETARRRPPAVIAELEASAAAMAEGKLARKYKRYRGFSEADEAFHAALMAGTGNEPAMKAWQDLRIHLHLSRLYISREQDTSASRQQHEAVLDAIKAGDPDGAARLMRAHLIHSKSRLLDEPSP